VGYGLGILKFWMNGVLSLFGSNYFDVATDTA